MSTCLSKRVVQSHHRRRGRDVVHHEEADSLRDQPQQEEEEADEAPEEKDEDDGNPGEADAEDEGDTPQAGGDDDQLSLPDLAEQIRQAHECCELLQSRAMASALRAGKLLMEARKRVRHGQWAKWVRSKARLKQRTAQRYIKLVRSESELDALDPSWRTEWSLTQALSALAEPTGEEDSADEQSDGEVAGEMGDEWTSEEAEADVKSTNEPAATTAEDRREARSLHRRAKEYLPKFLKDKHWKFQPGSREQAALERLEHMVVRAARSLARPLWVTVNRRDLPPELAQEVMAWMLMQKVIESKVEKLFRP